MQCFNAVCMIVAAGRSLGVADLVGATANGIQQSPKLKKTSVEHICDS